MKIREIIKKNQRNAKILHVCSMLKIKEFIIFFLYLPVF